MEAPPKEEAQGSVFLECWRGSERILRGFVEGSVTIGSFRVLQRFRGLEFWVQGLGLGVLAFWGFA